jgi:hypothetical protein
LAFFGTNLLSSLLGGGAVSIGMYPFYYLRIRLASDVCGEQTFKGWKDAVKRTNSQGSLAMYNGFAASMAH